LGDHTMAFEKGNRQEIEPLCGKLRTPLVKNRIVFSLIVVDGSGPFRKFGIGDAEQITVIGPIHGECFGVDAIL